MSAYPPPYPAPEMALEPPPPPPPDDGGSSFTDALASSVDQVILQCSNSSNPICFSTSISGANLITNLWISLVLGALCYILFVIFRGRFRFYQARLDMPQVTHKPPPLNLRGFHRLWSWLVPVFKVSDEELLLSAGMDALIAIRVLSFGILLFLPVTIAAMAILVPINYLDDYYKKEAETAGVSDAYTTVFIRLTMSNLTPGTPLMWVHFCFVYGVVFWTCWLITEQYKEYITLRQSYVIRSTALPDGALGGSMGAMDTQATPLLASRSPLKRKHILARFNSGVRHQLDRQNSAGSNGTGGGGTSGKVRRSGGSIKLPRRDASANGATVPVGGEAFAMQQQQQQQLYPPQQQRIENYNGAHDGTVAIDVQQQQQQQSQNNTAQRGVGGGNSGNTGFSSLRNGLGGPGAAGSAGALNSVASGLSRPSRLASSAAPNLTSNPTFSYHDQTTFVIEDSSQQQQQQQQHFRKPSSGGSSAAVIYQNQYAAAAGPAAPAGPGGGNPGDWTMHDFSQEVGHLQHNGSNNSNSAENAALAAAAAAFPPRSPMRHGNGNLGAAAAGPPPPFSRLMPQLSGINPVSRMPSNAAVAAALDPLSTAATAAQALEKIRHHRALSGASAAAKSASATPIMSSTPRRGDLGSNSPIQPPSPSQLSGTGGHRRSRSSAGGGGGGSAGSAGGTIPAFGNTTNMSSSTTTTGIVNNVNTGGGATTSGAGKPTPPPDLARIIEAVNALAEQQDSAGLDSNGDLPTVTAIAPEFAAPQGQDGIAHRWWSTLSTLGNRMVERRRSIRQSQGPIASTHSITFKGAVPMANQLTHGGAVLAANASLYTVLVTDQPIEKLRLKRPLGNMEFWHQRHNDGDPLGLQTTSTEDYVDPGEGPYIGSMPANSSFNRSGAGGGGGGGGGSSSSFPRNGSSSNLLLRGMTSSAGNNNASFGGSKTMQASDAPPSPIDVERGNTNRNGNNDNSNSTLAPGGVEGGNTGVGGVNETNGNAAGGTPAPSSSKTAGLFDAAKSSLGRVFSRSGGNSVMLTDPGAVERGMGISAGWSATLHGIRQYWRHRGRYREWRRDVRWAMFNKRVRTATDMFSELFGDDFDSIVPIYPTKSVEALIQQWDKTAAALERAQYKLKELSEKRRRIELESRPPYDEHDDGNNNSTAGASTSTGVTGGSSIITNCCHFRGAVSERNVRKLKEKISTLAAETAELQERISAERDAVLSDLPSTCFFATFKSQEAAAVAAQANLNPITQRLFDVQAAPSPDDVNWPALERSWWQRQARPAYVLPLIFFIMLLPIGAFTGAFAQLTIAFCGNPENPGPAANNWFCSDDRLAIFFRNILTSIAPSILLSLYHLIILPVLVYYAAQAEGRCFSLSQLDRRCAELFFYWDVFNVFLGAMLGGSVLSELPQYLDNPKAIWTTLSSAIPASSNFFINYVSYRALVMAWFRLFYPHQAVVACIFKSLRIIPWAKTARDKALEAPVRNCRYGRDIGIPVLMNFVMVMAYAVVSPLILPFGLLYFIFLWAVWRYQMLYVYQRQYESGGQFWPLVAHKVVGCLLLGVLFTAVVLIFKQGYAQAGLMLVTLPLYLLRFDNYLTTRYDAVVAQVPLMAVHKAGKVASVDPDLWTPPPLRQGAIGWNPEWGKVWQWWGVPRYTL